MDAPKRIFAWSAFPTSHLVGTWSVTRYPSNAEHYILAAEHDRLMAEKDAEIARLKLALGEILSYDRNFYDSGRPGYEAIARAALKESHDA